jgi:hypothetical protein
MDQSAQPTGANRPRPPWLIPLVSGVVGLLLGVGIGMAASGGGEPSSVVAEESNTPTPTGLTDPDPQSGAPSPEPTFQDPTLSDIELSLKTTEKQCFGSAGCNVGVRIQVSMSDSAQASLDPSGQWDVTYQITGDESGPIIGTFSIYGDGQYDVSEEFLSTRSSNTPITIKATSIDSFF